MPEGFRQLGQTAREEGPRDQKKEPELRNLEENYVENEKKNNCNCCSYFMFCK